MSKILEVGLDLGLTGVFFSRHITGIVEERHVYVGFRVARGARVLVPIPRAAEISATFEQADIRHAVPYQATGGHDAGHSAADHQHVDLLIQRSPVDRALAP